MNTRKIKTIIVCISIIIPLNFAFYYLLSGNDEIIDCTSAFSIINDNEEFSFSVTFLANNGNGLMTFSGNSGNVKDNISIRKYLSYVKNKNNIYIFTSTDENLRTDVSPLTNKFDEILPPFFTEVSKENKFIIKIIKIKRGTWVFMSTNTPYFICER
ncbi:TPA: hypothetical protein ACPYU1_000978 [Raoultella planticola]